MSELQNALKAQSFPSMDVRIAWALTVLCLIIGLLLTIGVLSVQVAPISGWSWVGVVAAQVITAAAVAGAARLTARRQRAEAEDREQAQGTPSSA